MLLPEMYTDCDRLHSGGGLEEDRRGRKSGEILRGAASSREPMGLIMGLEAEASAKLSLRRMVTHYICNLAVH